MTGQASAGDPGGPGALPAWVALLEKPYAQFLGSRAHWELRLPGGAPVRVERAGHGLNNAVFQVTVEGQCYVCKLFVADERRRAEREWSALCDLAAGGRKLAAEPVAFAPSGPLPQPAVIYCHLPGTPLSAQPVCQPELERLVQAMAQVHTTPAAPGSGRLPAWHQPPDYHAHLAETQAALERIERWAAESADALAALPEWVAGLPELLPEMREAVHRAEQAVAAARGTGSATRLGLVRMDNNLDNVIVDAQGGLAFVDWEYSGWGDPALDLAELRWHPRGRRIAAGDWQAALATYPAPADDGDFAERCAVYDQLLAAWWVGRSALHLLEGAAQIQSSQRRLVRVPARFYRAVRTQIDYYLAALGLADPPGEDDEEE